MHSVDFDLINNVVFIIILLICFQEFPFWYLMDVTNIFFKLNNQISKGAIVWASLLSVSVSGLEKDPSFFFLQITNILFHKAACFQKQESKKQFGSK